MTTKRILTLATVSALAVAATTIVATATLGAAGSTDEVRLHLGNDYQQFVYGSTTQNVGAKSNGNCTIKDTPAPTIMNYTVTGTRATPGFNKLGIGVSSASNPNGTPCAQVDPTESLTLTAGPALQGKLFNKVRLDLEMTGNAVVRLTFSRVSPDGTVLETTDPPFTLVTGPGAGALDQVPPYEVTTTGPGETVGACAAGSNSGPNSTINDNCAWTVQPGISFNRITLATPTPNATVSLEGGGDFGAGSDRDSVFYIADNGAPTAADDTLTTPEDKSGTGNVLTNDTDPEGTALTATLVTGPSNGTVTLAATGAFTYTPNANYNGSDSFTYAASDGTLSDQATVSITVTPDNDAPTAVPDNLTTNEDTPGTGNVLANDTDIDGPTLSAALVAGFGPDHGDVVLSASGAFTYTPDQDYNGTDSFKYTATDGFLSSSAIVSITVNPVNDPPVAVDDEAQLDANESSIDIPVLANDSDPENDALTPVVVDPPDNGELLVNGDGTITYTPYDGWSGDDSFTYQAKDTGNALSNTATVSVRTCSGEEVSDSDPDTGVTGTFTRLDDLSVCKVNTITLELDQETSSILFEPDGSATTKINYRGVISFGPKQPDVDTEGGTTVTLNYDRDGDGTEFDFEPVPWCINPHFTGGLVDGATIPEGDTWCIATETTTGEQAAGSTNVVTTWQVFGLDDPRFQ
jgi:VCBS repeat-containing protein